MMRTITSITLSNNKKKSSGVKFLLIVCCLFLLSGLSAQTITSTTTGGNWSATGTWIGGVVPSAANSVVINGPVTTNANASAINLTVNASKTLTMSGSNTLTVSGNLSVNGTINVGTATGAIAVNGNTSVAGTLALGAANFTCSGNTTVTAGSLTDGNNAGTNTFSGLVSVSSGATFSTANTSPHVFAGGISNAGTFSKTGTGAVTFNNTSNIGGTASLTIGGPVAMNGNLTLSSSITFSGAVTVNSNSAISAGAIMNFTSSVSIANSISFTNNGTATISGVLNGAGAGSNWVNASNATLNYASATVPMNTGNLDASAGGNLVNYTGAAQAVRGTTYNSLSVSGSGIKTIGNAAIVIHSALTVNTAITLTITSANFTLNGTLVLNGTLTDNSASGLDIFAEEVTISSGATFSSTGATAHTIEFRNGISAIGALNLPTVCTASFTTNNQTISGSNSTISVGNVTIGTGSSLTNSVTTATGLVIKGNLDGTSVTSTVVNGTNAVIHYQGSAIPMSSAGVADFSAAGNTFNYSGSVTQTAVATTYHHIGFTATGTKNIDGITVNGDFIRTNGTLVFTGSMLFASNSLANFSSNTALTLNDLVINKPGGSLTLTNSSFVANKMNISAGTFAFGITTARSITLNDDLSGNGTISMTGAAHSLILKGAENELGALLTDANISLVNYNRTGDQTVFGSQNYKSITTSGSGTKSLNGSIKLSGVLSMSVAGFISLNDYELRLTAEATLTGTFSSSRFIVTEGLGALVKEGTTAADFRTDMNTTGLYPVGAGGYYTPYTITALTATVSATGAVSVRAVGTSQPNVPYYNNALNKYWAIETTNLSAITATVRFDFNAAEVIGSIALYTPRVWNGSSLVTPNTPSANGSNPFTSTGTTFLAGAWTAIDPAVRAALYSYQSGDWGSANTWTTDPSGSTLVSPTVPGAMDQVVILNGRNITTTASRTVGSVTLNSGGVLDLGTSTGHSFGVVSGEGRLRLASTTLPSGTYTHFVSATGGTIEYYNLPAGPSTLSSTQTTYNNLEFTSASSVYTVNIAANSTVNGNLTLTRSSSGGVVLNIGNVSGAVTLNLNKNVTIGAGCIFGVSSYNANHTVNISGNLSNNGIIDFTNGTNYTSTLLGTASVNFSGVTTNTTAIFNSGSTTTFWAFTSTKNNGYELFVSASSGASVNFVHSGDVITALGNGNLRLGPNLTIPQLCGGGGGNYDVGSPGNICTFWIDGANVTYNGNGAIVPYGTLRISNGSLTVQSGQGGIVLRESGLFLVEGGTVNARMIRTSLTALTHRGSYIQTGGTVSLSGDNTIEQGYYAVFSLPYAENVFKMSGGTINITRTNTNGSYCPNGGILINCPPQNTEVTGGTFNISISGNIHFDLTSRAPFYNLNVLKSSAGTGQVRITPITWSIGNSPATAVTVPAYPLSVLGNLVINSANSPILNANGNNILSYGALQLNAGSTLMSGGNTLSFLGTTDQTFTLNGSLSTGLGNMIVNKVGTTLTLAGSAVSVLVNSDLNLLAGTLHDGGKTISVLGNVLNSATHLGTGKIQLNSTSRAQLISGSGIFQNLDLANTFGSAGSVQISTSEDIIVNGNLNLGTDRIFSIESRKLSLGASATITGTFGINRFIRCAGFLSDGGIQKTYSSATAFVFPVGTGTNYTPATIQFSATPATYGTLNIRPVASRQLYVTDLSCFPLYWKVNQTGFTGIPANSVNLSFNYGNLADNMVFIPGYFSYVTSSFTSLNNVALVNETNNTISFSAFNNVAGDYTAGIPAAFGAVTSFYSRASGNWETPSTWSNTGFGGTPASTIPQTNSPVIIGDGINYNHTVTVTADEAMSGSLLINAGSTLDLGTTTGHNLGALPYATAGGAGKIRISSTKPTAEFPSGDFGLFFLPEGGTTEYYSRGHHFNIPNITAAPSSMNIRTYNQLNLNPAGNKWINLPENDLIVYKNLTIAGDGIGSEVYTASSGSVTATVKGNLSITGGTLHYKSVNEQTISVEGDLTIQAGAQLIAHNAGNTVHELNLHGDLVNNGILDLNVNSKIQLNLLGNANSVITGTNVSAITDIYKVSMNKGTSQTLLTDLTVLGTFTAPLDNWLELQNGTFRISRNGTIALSHVSNSTFYIPTTAKLAVNSSGAVVNIGNNASNGADLILGGTLELIYGTVNVGQSSFATHNDIEYTPSDNPTIEVKNNAVLNVNGQIRRSLFSLQGALTYNQSGTSTVLVRGRNNEATGAFSFDRAKFEILGPESVFNMSENSLLIIDRTGPANTFYGDIFLNPETFSLTGGEVRIGTALTAAATTFTMQSTSPFWDLTVDGTTTSKTLNNENNSCNVLNDFTINGNSMFLANGMDVSIGRNFTNRNSSSSIGIAFGGFRAGTSSQTTTFNGSDGSQVLTGTGANLTNFANLILANTFSGGVFTLSSSTNITVNGNLQMNSGDVNLTGNLLTVTGNVSTEVATTTTGAGSFVMGGTIAQTVTAGSLASFQNFRMANAAGVELTTPLTINGLLQFNTGVLYINNYLLSLGANATIGGTLNQINMIRLNGVVSDGGVRKAFPANAVDFTFPIGTTLKYTPARYNFTSNTSTGTLTVKPVTTKHPATTDILDKELTSYWNVSANGFSGSYTVSQSYKYAGSDAINGNEAAYVAGRFSNSLWSPVNGIAGSVNAAADLITLTGVNYLAGDYTAGESPEFALIQTFFSRNATAGGMWNDINSWSTDPVLQHAGAACVTPPSFKNVVIASGHTITAHGNSISAPVATINGTLNLLSTFGHSFSLVSGTGTLKLTGTGSFVFPGGDFTAFTSTTGGTVEYSNASAATLPTQGVYNHLVFTGAGTKTLANLDILVNGNLTINAGVLSNTNNRKITLSGNFTNNVGTGGFVAGTGTVALTGANQDLSGATTFNTLSVSGSGTKLLNASMNASILNLTNGIIQTGSNQIFVSSTVNGGSSGSYVYGNLRKSIPANVTLVNFEIGDMNDYLPVGVNFNGSVSGAGSLQVSTSSGDHSAIYTSGINQNKSANRTWFLNPTSLSGLSSISINLSFVNADLDASANPQNFTGSRYLSSTWYRAGGASASGNSTMLTGNTNFGTFQLGEAINGIIWTGASDKNWHLAGNWLPNVIPDITDDIYIGPTANQPNVSTGTPANCRDMNVDAGVTISIQNSRQLSVYGNIQATNALIQGAGTLRFAGATTTLSGNLKAASNITIESGSTLTVQDGSNLEMQRNFSNLGQFNCQYTPLLFSGSQSSVISGNALSLFGLRVNKASEDLKLTLSTGLSVSDSLMLLSGDIDLNGQEISLGSTGILIGETMLNRVYGSSGIITCERVLNAPEAVNVGGLGIELTSGANLGSTIIRRSHQQQVFNAGFGMNRYYEIHPANNNSLNATLKFNYFDDELTTNLGFIQEAELDLWRFDGAFWNVQHATLDMANNQLVKTAIPRFSTWTAGSTLNNALPISLTSFKATCAGSLVEINWATASEINNKEFHIEESEDAIDWKIVKTIEGAGNSNSNRNYMEKLTSEFADGSYFRLSQVDYNGDSETFEPVYVMCEKKLSNELTLYPNPTIDFVNITLTSNQDMKGSLTLFSTSGQILLSEQVMISKGSNAFRLDLSALPPGSYHLNVASEQHIEISGNRTIIKR